MRAGLSLTQLAQKIEQQQAQKLDLIVDTRDATLSADGRALTVPVPQRGPTDFRLNDLAHEQVAGRLAIPRTFYNRLREDVPDLLATNVNRLFRENPERRMLRTLAGTGRAFLSNRYQRIDNAEIAQVVLPILADIPDVQFISTEITERRMYIQAVSPRVQGEVKKGDVVQAGVIISNSEVGAGSVSVTPLIFRLVCLNGMVCPDGKFRAYHVGRQVQDSEDLWSDDTRKADDRAVLLKARDMVKAAVAEATFKVRIEKMQGLTEGKIEGNPAEAVEVLAQKIGATEDEKGGILRALIEGADLSAWGLLNAVTAQANSAKSYDRAVELETAGGTLLELPKTEWTRMLKAA